MGIVDRAAEFVYTVALRPKVLKNAANWTLRQVIPKQLHYRGTVLALNPADPVVSGALWLNVYENAELDIYERLLRPGMTVVDVGANIGLYTALAGRRIGSEGKVFAFEPDPESCSFLRQTVECSELTNVVVTQAAVADKPGRLTLFRNPDNRGDSRLYADALLKDSVEVAVVTLDETLQNHGLQAVDFIKIDVQGAEGLALAGAQKTLRESPRLTLMMEFWPYGLSRTGHDAMALLQQLRRFGFTLFEAGPQLKPLHGEAAFKELIARNQGRQYSNLLATKQPERVG